MHGSPVCLTDSGYVMVTSRCCLRSSAGSIVDFAVRRSILGGGIDRLVRLAG